MDFSFSINEVFRDSITVVTADFGLSDKRGRFSTNREVQEIVDTIGERSARAQNLSSSITTWSKLKINKHKIFLLTDPNANNGRGHVLGFIKIGKKQLFILDRDGTQNEMHPLCILDFYIHESQQRKGYGLKLFRHMLQEEDVKPSHLAIDRPSSKFISFLRKHFNLWATIPQVNNFVVFDGFFKNRKDRLTLKRRTNKDFEDDFRPLSRAFSEDVIRRNRQNPTYTAGSLSGIRPASRLTSSGYGDHAGASHSSLQMPKANRFSRFAVDENYYIPSMVQNRRRSLKSRRHEEIVTNPYRRETNINGTDKMSHMHQADSDSKPLHEIQSGNEERLQDAREEPCDNSKNSQDKVDSYTGHAYANESKRSPISLVFQPRIDASDSKQVFSSNDQTIDDQNKSEIQLHETLFQAKTGHNSIRNPRYDKPSDMIAELKQKDMYTRKKYGGMHRPSGTPFGTSWNLFGVPSPTRRWPNK